MKQILFLIFVFVFLFSESSAAVYRTNPNPLRSNITIHKYIYFIQLILLIEPNGCYEENTGHMIAQEEKQVEGRCYKASCSSSGSIRYAG